ncbi:hypothetical protein CHUAL_008013 [Chamberlinius hualienensis]
MAAVSVVLLIFWILKFVLSANIFDTGTEMCCSGKIHAMPLTENGTSTYRKLNGTSNYRKLYCCGEEMYDLSTHVCCQYNVNPRPPNTSFNDAYFCCGPNLYNPDTSLCCDGIVYEGSGRFNDSGDITSEDLIKEIPHYLSYRHLSCCGNEIYDWRSRMCCTTYSGFNKTTSIRIRQTPFDDCCGEQSFDIRNEICCNGNIFPAKLPGTRRSLYCCGENSFVPKTQVCCYGSEVLNKTNSHKKYSCCGHSLQLKVGEMCCGDSVVSVSVGDAGIVECCGNKTYNVTSELCCDGVVQVIKNKEDRCCGTDIYNLQDKEFCCSKVVQSFSNLTFSGNFIPESLCCGNTTLSNPKTEMCCSGQITLRSSSNYRCCGSDAINPDQQLCCNGQIKVKSSATNGCCGDTMYNYNNQFCCHDSGNFTIFDIELNTGDRKGCCIRPQINTEWISNYESSPFP